MAWSIEKESMEEMKTKIIAISRWMLLRLPIGKRVYSGLVKKRRENETLNNRRLLQEKGWEALDAVHKALAGDFPFFVDYGTLLGLMRDHGFIPHDDDMDFGVMPGTSPAKLLCRLLDSGFDYKGAYEYDGKIREIAVFYHGLHIDFFFDEPIGNEFCAFVFYAKSGVAYVKGDELTAYRIRRPSISSIEEIEVNGCKFFIPSNYKDILVAAYGDSWQIPVEGRHAGSSTRYRLEEQPGVAKFKVPTSRVFALG